MSGSEKSLSGMCIMHIGFLVIFSTIAGWLVLTLYGHAGAGALVLILGIGSSLILVMVGDTRSRNERSGVVS